MTADRLTAKTPRPEFRSIVSRAEALCEAVSLPVPDYG
jgi:hypothetical protein